MLLSFPGWIPAEKPLNAHKQDKQSAFKLQETASLALCVQPPAEIDFWLRDTHQLHSDGRQKCHVTAALWDSRVRYTKVFTISSKQSCPKSKTGWSDWEPCTGVSYVVFTEVMQT